ncbi:MAG: SGNH/GDSL hydrolase family protein [Cyclobacteriaceae bacterium]
MFTVRLILLLIFFTIILCGPDVFGSTTDSEDSIKYHDGHEFVIVGKYHDEKNYNRLPIRYKEKVRKEVWDLGQNSAGISIRFRSNARTLIIRWSVMNDAVLPHMPSTGVKGLDLYAYSDDRWQYVKTAIPKGKSSERILFSNKDGITREYLLNLPLYDGVESLQIGINTAASISVPHEKYLLEKKPVVYYGTSIAQGGCASRPGMLFTNLMARALDRSFINLGFSGNGRIESAVGEAMCEVDAALYVIDCNPNTDTELIYDRTMELVQMLRKQRPDAPVLLVAGFPDDSRYFVTGGNQPVEAKTRELKRAFKSLRKSGVQKLYFQKGVDLIGKDHEGTVDGIHPNDVGMMRIAEELLPVIKKLL